MARIEVDEDVYAFIQSKAIAYVERSPNETLRRLLAIPHSEKPKAKPAGPGMRSARRRPRASLRTLVDAGLIENEQKLYLHDYQGRLVPDAVCFVGGDGVFADMNRHRLYSMSDLAAKLLKEHGYQSDAVRGPSHWRTKDGKSITELWESLQGD